jgi:hypothetical protein
LPNRKKIEKEIRFNEAEIRLILKKIPTPLSTQSNKRLHFLIGRNEELRNMMAPKQTINTFELDEKQRKSNSTSEINGYCKNCGAPNGNNFMNGKLWCFNCKRPLIVTYEKPELKWTPELGRKLFVTKEEIDDFYLKKRSLIAKTV